MEIVAFKFELSAATQVLWTPDTDYVLKAIQQTGASNVLVSVDPSLTVSEMLTPTIRERLNTVVAWSAGGSVAGVFSPNQLNIPIAGGSRIYLNSSGAKTAVLLYLDTVSAE